ncbi:cupin [Bacillaceae bacterium JMAK1]|nr:cupin [Bacillaceae bacterium JMAK1]
MKHPNYWIDQLGLQPHQEGGYFTESFMSNEQIKSQTGDRRQLYTSIYFLLTTKSPSHFHRLKSDEVWYYHYGAPLTVHMLHPDGSYEHVNVGPQIDRGQQLSTVVRAGTIFGSTVSSDYSLVSCVVSPGFDYADFEMFTQDELIDDYPDHEAIIRLLAYETLPTDEE